MSNSIHMATTKVSALDIIAQIEALLSRHGLLSSSRSFEDNRVSEMNFTVNLKGRTLQYRLPSRPDKLLKYAKRIGNKQVKDIEQAYRTSWRILLRWIQSQIEMVECELVDFEEVFMPYMVNIEGKTIYEEMLSHGAEGRLLVQTINK